MQALTRIAALAVFAAATTAAFAQTPQAGQQPMSKPIVKTTCADYVALDETIKPKFVYFAVGHSKKGHPDAVFDETAVEKIKPELDQYCKVNLTKSAYDKVMASSMASEKAERAAKK